MTARRRWLAAGGVVGPAWFIATWATLGRQASGYSPIEDPISRLAAVDAASRAPMTIGLVALGTGIGAYAASLSGVLPRSVVLTAAVTAGASFGVAALPLGSPVGGVPHAIAAGVAYASLASTPMLAARQLGAWPTRLSTAAGVVSGAALLASGVVDSRVGFFQRLGLTTGHLWIALSAIWLLRGGAPDAETTNDGAPLSGAPSRGTATRRAKESRNAAGG